MGAIRHAPVHRRHGSLRSSLHDMPEGGDDEAASGSDTEHDSRDRPMPVPGGSRTSRSPRFLPSFDDKSQLPTSALIPFALHFAASEHADAFIAAIIALRPSVQIASESVAPLGLTRTLYRVVARLDSVAEEAVFSGAQHCVIVMDTGHRCIEVWRSGFDTAQEAAARNWMREGVAEGQPLGGNNAVTAAADSGGSLGTAEDMLAPSGEHIGGDWSGVDSVGDESLQPHLLPYGSKALAGQRAAIAQRASSIAAPAMPREQDTGMVAGTSAAEDRVPLFRFTAQRRMMHRRSVMHPGAAHGPGAADPG